MYRPTEAEDAGEILTVHRQEEVKAIKVGYWVELASAGPEGYSVAAGDVDGPRVGGFTHMPGAGAAGFDRELASHAAFGREVFEHALSER